MKKLLISILLLIVPLTILRAQSALEDAIDLKGYLFTVGGITSLNVGSQDTWDDIFIRNDKLLSGQNTVAFTEIQARYKDNPFLNKYLPMGGESSGRMSSSSLGSAFSGLGGLNVSTIADGLARFLVKRTKEELSINFFEKLREAFEENPEITILFPSTSSILLNIYSHQYSTIIVLLREAFVSDIEDITLHLPELRTLTCVDQTCKSCLDDMLAESPICKWEYDACIEAGGNEFSCLNISCVKEKLDDRCDACKSCLRYDAFFNSVYGEVFISTSILLKELVDGTNPALSLHRVVMDSTIEKGSSNYSNFLRFGDLISWNLRDTRNLDNLWVALEDFNILVRDQQVFELFMGLLYQQNFNNPINFILRNGDILSFQDLLIKFGNNSAAFKEFLSNFVSATQKPNQQARVMGGFDGISMAVGGELYQRFLEDILGALEQLFDIDILQADIRIPENIKNILKATRSGVKIYRNLKLNNYDGALLQLSMLLDNALFTNFNFRGDFLKYGSFLAKIAEAEDSKEVSEIIDEYALPVGSSRIKRESNFNVALNSYVGGFYGNETITALGGDNSAKVAGVTAPLGVSISKGFKIETVNKTRELGSLTLYLSIIDVGAFTSFRFQDDSTSTLPAVRFENILAPGGFLIYGIPKTPISVGGGAQMGPMLRQFNDRETTVSENLNWRWNLFLTIDIPLLNFYTKPR